MKIASKIAPIKTRRERRITVFGKLYVFAPTKDAQDNTHFVAEINDEKAVDTLLSTGHYYRFGKDMQPKSQLTKTAANNGGEGGQGDGAGTKKPSGFNDEVIAKATDLLKGTIQDVSKGVASVGDIAIVQAALEIEKSAEQPRAGMVKLLESTIEMARQAGVIQD